MDITTTTSPFSYQRMKRVFDDSPKPVKRPPNYLTNKANVPELSSILPSPSNSPRKHYKWTIIGENFNLEEWKALNDPKNRMLRVPPKVIYTSIKQVRNDFPLAQISPF